MNTIQKHAQLVRESRGRPGPSITLANSENGPWWAQQDAEMAAADEAYDRVRLASDYEELRAEDEDTETRAYEPAPYRFPEEGMLHGDITEQADYSHPRDVDGYITMEDK